MTATAIIHRELPIVVRIVLLLLLIAAIASGVFNTVKAFAAEPDVQIAINIGRASPREVEETTQKAIVREYGNAWKTLAAAYGENRTDQLLASFVGAAKDTISDRVEQQRKNGLAMRIVDRGHKLDVVFYSPEGSAMQLRDVAQLEKQYLDGGKVIHSENITQSYVVIMTVAEDRWKVRLLQELQ